MPLSDLLTPDAIIPSLRVNGKKQALQEMSERAAVSSGLPAREIFDALLQRERLGSTGVGDGIAIPHGKLAKCGAFSACSRASSAPIDFEALDGLPVDLIFLLDCARERRRRPFEGAGDDRARAAQSDARRRNCAPRATPRRSIPLLTLTPTSNAAGEATPKGDRPMKARVDRHIEAGGARPARQGDRGGAEIARRRGGRRACARARCSTSSSTRDDRAAARARRSTRPAKNCSPTPSSRIYAIEHG